MSGKRDSNSRPRPWQGRALPTELFPLISALLTALAFKRDAKVSPAFLTTKRFLLIFQKRF